MGPQAGNWDQDKDQAAWACLNSLCAEWFWRNFAFSIIFQHQNGAGSWNYSSWTWWWHQMETFSVLLAICTGNSPVTGEFPAQRPVMRSFDVFFDLHLNKQMSKQWWGWWFEMPLCPLYDVTVLRRTLFILHGQYHGCWRHGLGEFIVLAYFSIFQPELTRQETPELRLGSCPCDVPLSHLSLSNGPYRGIGAG